MNSYSHLWMGFYIQQLTVLLGDRLIKPVWPQIEETEYPFVNVLKLTKTYARLPSLQMHDGIEEADRLYGIVMQRDKVPIVWLSSHCTQLILKNEILGFFSLRVFKQWRSRNIFHSRKLLWSCANWHTRCLVPSAQVSSDHKLSRVKVGLSYAAPSLASIAALHTHSVCSDPFASNVLLAETNFIFNQEYICRERNLVINAFLYWINV